MEQHKDNFPSKSSKDTEDSRTLFVFFERHNPFQCDFLQSIYNGLIAEDKVNADCAEEIGQQILSNMDGKSVKCPLSRRSRVVTLASRADLSIDNDVVVVSPQLLFQRLVTVAQTRTPQEIQNIIGKYELATFPASLFDGSGMPLSSQKSQLARYIRTFASEAVAMTPNDARYVVDGGSLLHKINTWPQGATYGEILGIYCDFVTRHYGTGATVVFDGYGTTPTTKTITHQKGNSGCNKHRSVNIALNLQIHTTNTTSFLAAPQNKAQLICLLQERLQTAGVSVQQAAGDADWKIVQQALNTAMEIPCILVGDDTDLLVMLLHHTDSSHRQIYMHTSDRAQPMLHIQDMQSRLGADTCSNILFAHAFTGCDATSRLHGIGKTAALRKLKNPEFLKIAEIFGRPSSTKQDIEKAGEEAVAILYGGKPGEELHTLRYKKYAQKVAKGTMAIAAKDLPPTQVLLDTMP